MEEHFGVDICLIDKAEDQVRGFLLTRPQTFATMTVLFPLNVA